MAERRMFAKTIIDSDAFLDMPLSTQALYFHLSMRADDDGFVNNPKRIQRMIGASDDDMRVLIGKQFIITFDTGVVVIKHWRIHNYIRNDRYKETACKGEAAMLALDETRAYTVNQVDTVGIPNGNQLVYQLDTQDRLGKDRLGKDRIESVDFYEKSTPGKPTPKKPIKHHHGEYNNVLLTDDELTKIQDEFPDWQDRIERLSEYIASSGKSYKSHYATIRAWARKDKDKAKPKATGFSNAKPQRQSDFDDLQRKLIKAQNGG